MSRMMSNRELWQNALVQIELGTSEASFRTWFRNTDIVSRDSSVIQVAVPSKIVKEWLMDKHHKLILGTLRALAAAKAVVERPGLAYNPFFVYGSTGHGKTHLIQAIGNHFKKTHSNKKVFYVSSERFAVDFINAVQKGRANEFKDQYRQYDVLIMDDVQFMAEKERTQEELFHLFNAMHDNNKQIIFSSDKHPVLLPGFEDRVRGRLAAGVIM